MTENDERGTHRIEILAGRLFLGITVAALLFGLAELLSRKFLPNRSRSRFEARFEVGDFRHPRPYVMFGGKPGAAGLNAGGYMGPMPACPKPPGEYRIVLLGGSALVEGNPTIVELVEQELRLAKVGGFRTYNFGVVSSSSGMDLARLLFEVGDLEPDLVVMYNGGNDLLIPLFWDPRPGYPFNFIAYENHPLLDRDVGDYPALTLFLYGSNILRTLLSPLFVEAFVPLQRTRASVGYFSEGWREEIVARYVANLRKARKVSGAFGADFVAFVQPLVAFKEAAAKEEVGCADPALVAFLRDTRARLASTLRRLATEGPEERPEVVDLTLIFENSKEWDFSDAIHTTRNAKLVIARAIAGQLLGRQERPASSAKCSPRGSR